MSTRPRTSSAIPGSSPARSSTATGADASSAIRPRTCGSIPGCGLRHGIYAVRVAVDGKRYDGVANFGRRPMFDTGIVLLEVFLFDFSGDLYGRTIDVAFIAWIRPEMMFDSVADLVRRMEEDCRLARNALRRAGDVFPPLGELAAAPSS